MFVCVGQTMILFLGVILYNWLLALLYLGGPWNSDAMLLRRKLGQGAAAG